MNRAVLPVLCGSAIALAWASHINLFPLFNSVQTSVQAQELDVEPDFQPMTLARLEDILTETVGNLDGQPGQWQFDYEGVSMLLATSEEHDRMRLIAPIADLESLTAERQQKMLVANFHTALDARYAIGSLGNQPAIVAVFVHPLSSLHEDHFRSALSQVGQAAQTFGTTYSSGGLLLRPGSQNRPTNSGENLEI